MNDILAEIREYIKNGYFKNEENVRFSLVARILKELGWDIWNPNEVSTEFNTVPNEDKSRVDIALFDKSLTPSVFIEIKAIGKLDTDLVKYEVQLRDYNRNNTAPFSIITDGREWRFYYSQTGGEFSQKCFKVIDLLDDAIADIALSLYAFLSKEKIRSGNAKNEAETYLKLSQKQRVMEDAFPQARRQILEPPFPSLPEALIRIVEKDGFTLSIDEASHFVKKQGAKKPTEEATPVTKTTRPSVDKPKRSTKTSSNAGKSISSFIFNNTTYEVRYWIEILITLCDVLSKTQGKDFQQVLNLVGRKRPYFATDENLLRIGQKIEGTNIFFETNLSANSIVKLSYDVISLFGYSKKDLQISAD